MATIARHRVSLVVGIALALLPFALGATVTATTPSANNATDACKSGEAESAPGGGAISGGGRETNDLISVIGQKVIVKCQPVKPGGKATVTFCTLDGTCQTVWKDSQEGQNLKQMSIDAIAVGIPQSDGTYRVNPQDLLNHTLSPEQMNNVENNLIGKVGGLPGSDLINDYGTVVSMIGNFAAGEEFNSNYNSVADDAINAIARLSSAAEVANPPIQTSSLTSNPYPPSYKLSEPPTPYGTDAYPTQKEPLPSPGPAVPTFYDSPLAVPQPTNNLTTFGNPLSAPSAFDPYTVSLPIQSNSNVFQNLIDEIKSFFSRWFSY